MGFHPEFTGRQNVMMAGQLLSLSLTEIEGAFSDIERFADIGDFMDQPLRTYSSGMQMRLAFSVATAVRPDVLIVDEALSVGDVAFQRKCYRRIEAFRAEGTAVLFVSHDIEAVKRLCDQAIFLADGGVASVGPVKTVCDAKRGRCSAVALTRRRQNSCQRRDRELCLIVASRRPASRFMVRAGRLLSPVGWPLRAMSRSMR